MKITMTLEFTVDDNASGYHPEAIAEVIVDSLSDRDIQDDVFAGSNIEVKLSDGYFVSAKFIPV